MTQKLFIIWRQERGDWEIGEMQSLLPDQHQHSMAYAIHKPTGDSYFFSAGFGCEPEAITHDMLVVVSNYLDDWDCGACLSTPVAVLYQRLLSENSFPEL